MNYLRKHPIVTSVLLGILFLIVTTILSVINGHHFYYRIFNAGDKISNVHLQQFTENREPIKLLEQTGVDYDENYTMVYFSAIKPGSGFLDISYTRQTPDGQTIEVSEEAKLMISKPSVVYIGEGVYNHNGISVFHFGICIYSFLMMLYFIWRRGGLKKSNRYSYAYMSTWSSQVFFTGVFLTYAAAAAISIIYYKYIDVYIISGVTRYLMLIMTVLTLPLVLIFAISMTISNISLIRHEGKRFQNMLGIISGLGLMGAILVIVVLFVLFALWGNNNLLISILYCVVNALYIVFFAALSGAIISGLLAGHYNPAMDKDYIIILGCAIRKDGTLYPLIRGRVDRAINFWKEQELKTGKKAVFVPSGGKGSDEIISEGEAMKRYLLEQGIPEEYIMAETKSENTYENMKFSKELIESHNPDAKIAFSTTNYHVMRGGILATKVGLYAEGMGAPTKWYFWPNALLREVVGMFVYQPKTQIITMLVLATLGGLTGYLYYLIS